ncbi:MAG TPA: virulence-associated E family protein [Xanthobacteraceae bacterium]
MAKIVNLPMPVLQTQTEAEHARADTERNRRLFAWALSVLKQLGIDSAVAAAKSVEELHRVQFDPNAAEIILAIRDALHPASGRSEKHFRGLKEAGLKQILKNRFAELKKERVAALRRQGGREKHADWTDQLILTKDGRIVANLANLVLMLREAPKWKGVLGYNEFTAMVVIRKLPPWGMETTDTAWTDQHETQARVWFQRHAGVSPSAGDVGRAVQAAARHSSFHPVRDYFNSLVWDGKSRLAEWLQTYFHAEDSKYVRAIGPRYLISGAARIYDSGAQVDHVLIFEGPQGKLKSTALRKLAVNDAWFTDKLSNISGKDAMLETAGVLIVELAEMDALTKASTSAMKAFLTRRYDRFRPPWGKHTIRVPRQCIFAGTINPPAVGGYLKDPTGARRFWPAACRGMIDCDGLERDRDHLWAEAVHLYKAGMPWWLTPELEVLANAEQAARFMLDAWDAPIREWLGDRTDVTVWEVLESALGLSPEKWTQPAQKRVVGILTNLGFEKRRPRTGEGRENRYQRDPALKKSTD